MESQRPNDGASPAAKGVADDAPRCPPDASAPIGYLTTASLAALWAERRRETERHRRAHPDDLPGIELRQRIASQLLQTLRVLADLEQQLGIVLGLPVLGAGRTSGDHRPGEDGAS